MATRIELAGFRRQPIEIGSVLLGAGIVTIVAMIPGMSGYSLLVVALVGTQIIAALSLNVLMGYAGQVSLGQAAFVGVGAYTAAQLAQWLPFPLPLLAAVLLGALVSTIVGLPSLRIRGLQVAATTLAFGIAAGGVLFARPWSASSASGVALSRPALLSNDHRFALLVWGVLAVLVVADRLLTRSRLGRAMKGVRDREENAAAWGIPVGRTKLQAYAVSGAYAGIAGAMYGYLLQRVTPGPFDVWASLGLVAAAVIGGRASLAGVALAAGALSAGPEVLRPLQFWAPFLGAALLVLVPVLKPEGLGWIIDRPLPLRLPAFRAPTWVHRRTRAGSPPVSVPALTTPPVRPVSLVVPIRTLLEVRDLRIRFGGVAALTAVNLEVRRHEIVGLIGPNGAGKTTVFNCISGLVKPSGGRVLYRGIELLDLPAHARQRLGIARTFQQVGLCLPQTVRENVLLAQHPYARTRFAGSLSGSPGLGYRDSVLRKRAEEAIDLLGLGDYANARVGDLPHVTQRLVELAAALSTGPELLMLDEPASGLSPEESNAFVGRFRSLREELSLTVLLIEHHLPVVTRLCNYVYVLAEGHVLAEGRPDQIQHDESVAAVYLGRRPAQAVLAGTPAEKNSVAEASSVAV